MFTEISPKQASQLALSTARINLAEGAVRAGKTVAYILKLIDYALHGPEGPIAVIGKTERTLRRNMLDPLGELLGKRLRINYGTGEGYLGKRKLYLYGANDERAIDKIRGATLAGAFGDECATWPESFWVMLLSRLSVKGAQLFGTLNPESPYHWLKSDWIEKAEELGIALFHYTIDDNPFLDRDYVESLKREYLAAGQLWYDRLILGLWVLAEGAIYPMFTEKIHVKEPPHDLDHYAVSVDYGSGNPTAFGLFGWKGDSLPAYLLREFYYDGRSLGTRTDAQLADDFQAWLGDLVPDVVYCDPSALSFKTELRNRGYPVKKGNNDVLDGIRFVGKTIGQRLFFVAPGCIETKREFSAYIWDAKAQDRGEDKPIKNHDHIMDLIRYFLFTHFGRFQTLFKGIHVKG